MIWRFSLIISSFIIITYIRKGSCRCYFPGELQGVWATQAAPDVRDAPIGYTMVTINAEEISSWGQCHSKVDDNIILADSSGGPNSARCLRCFRLVVASINLAVLVSGGGLKTCLSSVSDALATCPTTEKEGTHIVLYKVRSSWGESGIQETQCPFSGIYFFSYDKGTKGHRGSGRMRCEQPTSEMSNCPFGFSLSLQFRDCTFEEPTGASWHCLGTWKGLDGQQYTAVYDMYSKEGDGKPKYKCGIFNKDAENKRVFLSFSRDSTCTNDLISATQGHERFVLYEAPTSPLPSSVRDRTCRFPTSLRGGWHNTQIRRSTIIYRDERNFDTLHMQCVREYGDLERYAVYTRTDCGKWFFTCILLKRRSANVIELMFGKAKMDTLDRDICNMKQFGNLSTWITQARTHLESPTSCPIVGTYRGELPDSPGYCAQLFSDCKRTDLMYYAVDECKNPTAIYEQREYQCIGQWEENGRIYALTKRRDIHTFECFVGVKTLEGVVYMKEAGSSCSREVRPDDFGMKTVIKEECIQEASQSRIDAEENRDREALPERTDGSGWRGSRWISSSSRVRETSPTRPPWVPSTTRPWKPITGRPRRSISCIIFPRFTIFISNLVVLYFINLLLL